MSIDSNALLSSDRPAQNPEADRLGYAPFALNLATSICQITPSEGLVPAVFGPWGLGKSTLINFIKEYLARVPEESRPVVVSFNPWWFSDSEDLTRRFFDQLLAAVGATPLLSDQIRTRIADFADIISKIPVSLPGTPLSTATLHDVAAMLRPKPGNVVATKEEVAKALRNYLKKLSRSK
jgi:predicted KAP-like P-loop ATPase